MDKLIELKKETNNKFLNLYRAYYETQNGKTRFYEFASRKDENNCVINNPNNKPDAVRILPYYKKGKDIFVVFIKEFRSPLNKYIYGLPAGLVDDGEKPIDTGVREIYEEIGGKVLNIEKVIDCAYSDAGLTDESLTCFNAEVELNGLQHLEENEDIKLKIVKLEDLLDFVENNEFCLPSALQAQAFYFRNINTK